MIQPSLSLSLAVLDVLWNGVPQAVFVLVIYSVLAHFLDCVVFCAALQIAGGARGDHGTEAGEQRAHDRQREKVHREWGAVRTESRWPSALRLSGFDH